MLGVMDPYAAVEVHERAWPFVGGRPQTLTVDHGGFSVETLDTAARAAAGVREFALILTHPKLRGATGAWTSPIALV